MSDNHGMDKSARLAAERAAKAAANKAPALDPGFPYRVEAFPFTDILKPQNLSPATTAK